jgi:branched-chain amino acid transport system substrate-binding protein
MKGHLAAAAALLLLTAPARAADSVKIGFVTTLSGPAGVIGKHMKDSADLALAMLGGKIGGRPAEIVYGDDQFKPDVGRQVADEMLKRDKVDFLTGFIWSNVLLAVYQPVIQSGTILISANAGPHEIAGEKCAPNFFSASWQNDQTPEAMGKFMDDQKMSDLPDRPRLRRRPRHDVGLQALLQRQADGRGLYQVRPIRFPGRIEPDPRG